MPACPRRFGSTPVPLAYFDTNFTYASTHMRQHSHDHLHSSASVSDSAGTADSISTHPWVCKRWILPHMASRSEY
jgi:hypothetical protein